MKGKEKRIVRGYKCAETPYRKAMKRAIKQKTTLASLIEDFVIAYGMRVGSDATEVVDAFEAYKKANAPL